jgi:ceramide glucosyltransferase
VASFLSRAISGVTFAAAAFGCAYTAFALVRALGFAKRASRSNAGDADAPPLTVLKPICGLEAELYENLRSFCEQDYPAFQVIFGVAERDDPALAVVERVVGNFPDLDLTVVVGSPHARQAAAINPKVANLAGMIGHAKYDIVVIADADMRVGREYLRAIAGAFENSDVGAATMLYCGSPVAGIASALGALHINDHFAPSVLVATALGPMRFCFGATMAVRRAVLAAIGGLDALASRLGDDYVLGALVTDGGYEVALPAYVVRNVVFESSLPELWQHELRWARTIRAQRPLGYAFLFLTNPLPSAVLFLAGSGSVALGLGLIGVSMALRIALHYAMARALRIRQERSVWLVPLRDALSCAVWVASFFGRDVRWRQRGFTVGSGGAIAAQQKSRL